MATVQTSVLAHDSRKQLDDLLMQVCEELQLAQTRYELAVARYEAVNRLLEAKASPFRGFNPRIYPHGSMALGTTVKPIDGPHDLDFVLELNCSHIQVEPMTLLFSLFDFLKENEIYKDMTTLKKRCVRVTYADDFYMDILPACKDVVSGGTCIFVPDRTIQNWTASNPEGLIRWFYGRCESMVRRLVEKAKPIPPQMGTDDKYPLQLAIQLLKRWRDLHYSKAEHAPVSVALTTLAAEFYRGESSISDAVSTILAGIVSAIDAADSLGERIAVCNPSNPHEDFGERWDSNPGAYEAFTDGIRELTGKWQAVVNGGRKTNEQLESLFGEYVRTVVLKQARRMEEVRKAGQLGVTSAGAITGLGSAVTRIRPNTFHGHA
jgi:SMODS domain-containing protein